MIKRDPGGYLTEFRLQYSHYEATRDIFMMQPSKNSKEFGDLIMFIAQVSHCYPKECTEFRKELMQMLDKHATVLDAMLRRSLVQALILIRNRGLVEAREILPLFFKLFRCQDKLLRKQIFQHIVADLQRSNAKHRDDKLNRKIQNFLYSIVNEDNEISAKKSLCVLTQMYHKRIWSDANTVNVVANAVFHKSSRITVAALKFFMGHDDVDSDVDSDEEEEASMELATREDIYKAFKKGTKASKRKKQLKLKRAQMAMKKLQKAHQDKGKTYSFTAIQLLHDPQGFGERLFSKLNKTNERWETKLLMMNVISRVIGVHQLLILNYYSFLQKYLQPHQKEVTQVLSALIQATHNLVPDDVLAPVTRQVCNYFINDKSRPEAMVVGLKTVREMCVRQPLIMSPDLLQDLAQYKKFKEKGVSMAARSLIGLFRILSPGMLHKKDRGKGSDMDAGVEAYGEFKAASGVEGIELLRNAPSDSEDSDSDMDSMDGDSGDEGEGLGAGGDSAPASDEEGNENEEEDLSEGEGGSVAKRAKVDSSSSDGPVEGMSLRQLKKLAKSKGAENGEANEDDWDHGILQQEDFERLKELKQKALAKKIMEKFGLSKNSVAFEYSLEEAEKLLDSRQRQVISDRKMAADDLEYTKQYRKTKEERLKSVLAGREGREGYTSAASRRKSKSGGLSNREKRKKKFMPLAARVSQAKSRVKNRRGKGRKRNK